MGNGITQSFQKRSESVLVIYLQSLTQFDPNYSLKIGT